MKKKRSFLICLLVVLTILSTACSTSSKTPNIFDLIATGNYEEAIDKYNKMGYTDENISQNFILELNNIYEDYENEVIDYDTAISLTQSFSKTTDINISNEYYSVLRKIEELNESRTAPETSAELPTETDPEPYLSNECDLILAEGYDENDNLYQLVGNESESYDGITIELGIIKNNKWLLEMSTDTPFHDEPGKLHHNESSNYSLYDFDVASYEYEYNYMTCNEAKFGYIGNGCFYYDGFRRNVIYNSNTKKSMETNEIFKVRLSNNKFIESNEIIVEKTFGVYELIDTTTMSTISDIKTPDDSYHVVAPYSEGLYLMKETGQSNVAFYNTSGKEVISLKKYYENGSEITNAKDGIFVNGEYTFEVENEKGTQYSITIDKKGKEVSAEEIY